MENGEGSEMENKKKKSECSIMLVQISAVIVGD